jgi:hypothetical protein
VVSVADSGPATAGQDREAPIASVRPLRAAEITAIGAGRRLYQAETIGSDATVNTILGYIAALDPAELQALQVIGDRSFGICARAGVHYQQAADLLSQLHER